MSHHKRSTARIVGIAALALAAAGVTAGMGAAWVAAAPAASATRTDQLKAPGPVRELELAVVNGDVRVVAGPVFAATVVIKARADDQASADALLARAKVPVVFENGLVKLETPFWKSGGRQPDGAVIEASFSVTLPPGAEAKLRSVNAGTKVDGIAGPLTIDAVNGHVEVTGAKKDLKLRSVNGKVEAHLAELAAGARVSAETVNGSVTLWVPDKTQVRLSARTLNGDIVSTLPLPPQTQKQSFGPPHRHYQGATAASGTAEIEMKSVNGRLALLAERSDPAQAKALVVIQAGAPGEGRWPLSGRGRGGGDQDDEDIRRDKVEGDFVVEHLSGDIRVENVTGRVQVKTSGDVRIGAVGKAAEIYTAGGDVRVDSVKGAVQIRSAGGDVRVGDVAGDARVETQGGDVRVDRSGGNVTAFTQGGDITLRGMRGGVKAETAGGDVTVEIVGKESAAGSEIVTQGGDVSLILPANFHADVRLETRVQDPNGHYISSEFPELTVVRGPDGHTATGKIGGGGPKLLVRSLSGEVSLKKGANWR